MFDDATTDHEQFERRQLAEDRDRCRRGILRIGNSDASRLVEELLENGTVEALPRDQLWIHVPSGRRFEGTTALAYFHEGWMAGRESGSGS